MVSRTRPDTAHPVLAAATVVIGLLVIGPSPVHAQPRWEWLDHQTPSARWKHSACFDTDRGVLVLFGGQPGEDETWEWDGTRWRLKATTGPSARWSAAMVYDRGRGRTVLIGGRSLAGNSYSNQVWEWDGNAWVQRTDAPMPQARAAHAMAFDVARGRTVVYGGRTTNDADANANTMEYDGTSWQVISTATHPGLRVGHAMAYDIARQRTVLVGSGGATSMDTWEWDGSEWVIRSFTTIPAARDNPALAYDEHRQVTVLMGGDGVSNTWEYDGAAWTLRTGSHPGGGRDEHAMAYDSVRQRTLMLGGIRGWPNGADFEPQRAMYSWDGTAWELEWSRTSPGPRHWPGLCFDTQRGVAVMYGGIPVWADGRTLFTIDWTCEWNGQDWTIRTPANNPGGLQRAPLVYDSVRGVSVLYGGTAHTDAVSAVDRVWEWDGTDWTERPLSPAGSRYRHAAAFDAARGKAVFFGGNDRLDNVLGDTWEYDGTTWTQVALTGPTPLPRQTAEMVYDAARGKVVLFGGNAGNTYFNDTWEWDGGAWAEVNIPAAARPPVRTAHAMAYDSDHGRVLMIGGAGANTALRNDQWVFDGAAWTALPGAPVPDARFLPRLTYDTVRHRFVAFGGETTNNSRMGTSQTFGASICPADWNGDGVVNSGDVSAYLAGWLASLTGGNLAADYNGDFATNSSDISAFLTAWLAGVVGGC